MTVDRNILRKRHAYAFGNRFSRSWLWSDRGDDSELIASQPRHKCSFADPFKAACDLAEQFIADHMAKTIVDLLEPVEVET